MTSLPCRLASVLLTSAYAAVASAGGGISPFTSEAVQRGLSFTLMNFPQQTGFYGFGCGFADLDGDGDQDALILGGASWRVGVFENLGDGTFTDRTLTSGMPPMSGLSALATADYDGDGDVDVFLSRAFETAVLFQNDGGFSFTDVTFPAGIDAARVGKGVCWGDYNGDGYVDLYICNYRNITEDPTTSDNFLYHNNGDGTFTDVAAAVGVNSDSPSLEAVWTDFDRDGDLDLYVCNDRGTTPGDPGNELFRNDGGVFTDIGAATGTDVKIDAMGLACGDFDADGLVDFYVTNTSGPELIPYQEFPLLLSQGDGTFLREELLWGVAHPSTFWGWGAFFFDWNNDGRLDLYAVNQQTTNSLFQNNGAPAAVDVTAAAQIGGPVGPGRSTYCAAFADIDGDGDLDILINALTGPATLHINHEGSKRNWVGLHVIGVGPNTTAIGANAEITANRATQFQEIYSGGNSYLGQNQQELHFGLGRATSVSSAAVRWPSNGPVRTFTSMPAGVRWNIYPPARLGDSDLDGDVDFADRVALCAAINTPVTLGVEMLDFNGDFVINAQDLAAFKAQFTSAGGRWSDLDADGVVGGADLANILGAWGSATCLFDLNADGTVDAADLSILLGDWG
ncbi:MAG: FG-GAP-like repeat-containing protein [Phycisphaerae bacterium]|nr:FG-GAP-like repeat-containing protein [Phycisphaerae bacterium]